MASEITGHFLGDEDLPKPSEDDIRRWIGKARQEGRAEELRYWKAKLLQWDAALAGSLGELCDEGLEGQGPYWSVKDVRDEMVDLLEGIEKEAASDR